METTNRGFQIVKFKDANGVECSLQQSSAVDLNRDDALGNPGASFIWLGCNNADPKEFVPGGDPSWQPVPMPGTYIANTRMHLNAEQVRTLINNLQSWLDTGAFDCAEWPDIIGAVKD